MTTKYARVTDSIYVGNQAASRDLEFLSNAAVLAVINLTGVALEQVDGTVYFDVAMSANELMVAEFQRMTEKLERVAKILDSLADRVTLIVCPDGKNSCMLCAGYYLVKYKSAPYADLIERLETLYLSAEQREIEIAERRAREVDQMAIQKSIAAMSPADAQAYWRGANERRELLCLTNSSFRTIIRTTGGAPLARKMVGARRSEPLEKKVGGRR